MSYELTVLPPPNPLLIKEGEAIVGKQNPSKIHHYEMKKMKVKCYNNVTIPFCGIWCFRVFV